MTSIRYGVCHIGFKGNVILALEGILLSTGLLQMGSCCTLVLFKMGDCLGKGISGLTVCPPPLYDNVTHASQPETHYLFVFVLCICICEMPNMSHSVGPLGYLVTASSPV